MELVGAILRQRFSLEGRLIFQGVELTANSRLKTVEPTLQKLRRGSASLGSMQDLAGLRIVGAISLSQQDGISAELHAEFPEARTVDRRAVPSHGYRAVHVVPIVDDYPVEIQLRTETQDD